VPELFEIENRAHMFFYICMHARICAWVLFTWRWGDSSVCRPRGKKTAGLGELMGADVNTIECCKAVVSVCSRKYQMST
jgi:hypothetical protein